MSASQRAAGPEPHSAFDPSAGQLCLDFVNTLADRPVGEQEGLEEPADLLAWARDAGLVESERARRLASRLEGEPRKASELLRRSIDLRESLYRLLRAATACEEAPAEDLARFNRELGRALREPRLEPVDGAACCWRWGGDGERLEALLRPVVRSAASLLTSPELSRLRECGGRRCSWLFIDRSRGGRRRWCDMKVCGNREKARRHYERTRAARRQD